MKVRLAPLLIWFLAPAGTILGQGLELSAASAAPGEWTVIQMTFKAPAGKEVLALQWDILVPPELSADWDHLLRLRVSVQEAGKSVRCTIPDPTPSPRTLRCILSGGRKPIPTGALAVLSFQVRENTGPGSVAIRLQKLVGVDRDMGRLSFAPVETAVTVLR